MIVRWVKKQNYEKKKVIRKFFRNALFLYALPYPLNFLKDTDVALSVIASKENGTFMEHLVEFIKLRVYELFLVS